MLYEVITLVERPRLSDITFHGLKKSEIETVSEKVAMMKGSQVRITSYNVCYTKLLRACTQCPASGMLTNSAAEKYLRMTIRSSSMM